MSLAWETLAGVLEGQVLLPGSAAYEAARRPAIENYHHVRPQAIARCASAADVAEAIRFARGSQSPVAVRSGGHCFAGGSSTAGMVIDVAPMRAVSVGDGRVTVGAGATLGHLYDALAVHGLTLAAGCGPTVGIAGLALGGGFGVLGRRHGLTADQLLAAEVVLADSRAVRCDEHHDPDLLWGLRGAGGTRFGVLTSLELRTVRAPETTTFHLRWPFADAVAVIDAWQKWAPDGPDELAASLLVTASRDPGQPPVVHVFGAMHGSAGAATAPLAELVARAGAEPSSTASAHGPYREAKRGLAEHGPGDEGPGPMWSASEFFREPLPPEAIAALADGIAAGRTPGVSRELDFNPWGGAYGRVRPDATAFAHRDARFLLKHGTGVDRAAGAAGRDAALGWLERSRAAVRDRGTGGVYPNFPEPDRDPWDPAYHGQNLGRLRQVAERYDPDGFFGRRERPGLDSNQRPAD